jgi:hypothetical protein
MGHSARIGETNKYLAENLKRGRTNCKWEGNIKIDIREI